MRIKFICLTKSYMEYVKNLERLFCCKKLVLNVNFDQLSYRDSRYDNLINSRNAFSSFKALNILIVLKEFKTFFVVVHKHKYRFIIKKTLKTMTRIHLNVLHFFISI